MQETIMHPVFGEIVYNENAVTGKKSITVNGVAAAALSRKEFLIDGKKATLKGSFITGVELYIDGEKIILLPSPRWYESLLSVLPFIFILIWGNNLYLCSIFPVLGGALGGALGALGSMLSLMLMKKASLPINKVLIGLAAFILTVLASAVLAFALIMLMV